MARIPGRYAAAIRAQTKSSAPFIKTRLQNVRWRERYFEFLDAYGQRQQTTPAARLINDELARLPRMLTALKAYRRASSTTDSVYSQVGFAKELADWVDNGTRLLRKRIAFLRRWRRQIPLLGRSLDKVEAVEQKRNYRIVVMRWGAGFSIPAIANRVNMTADAVRQVLRREKANLLDSRVWKKPPAATKKRP